MPSLLSRHPAPLRTRGVAVFALLALLGTGCARGPVTVNAPTADVETQAACAALVAALPDTVADLERRTIRPTDALGAAWGDPAIVLTCGEQMPPEFDGFSRCQEVDGVGWYVPEESFNEPGPVAMTTIGFDPVVRVDVPEEYFPPAPVMTGLAEAIRETLTLEEPCL